MELAGGVYRVSSSEQKADYENQSVQVKAFHKRQGWQDDGGIKIQKSRFGVSKKEMDYIIQEVKRRKWKHVTFRDIIRMGIEKADDFLGFIMRIPKETGARLWRADTGREIKLDNENIQGIVTEHKQKVVDVLDRSNKTIQARIRSAAKGSWDAGRRPYGFDLDVRDYAGRPLFIESVTGCMKCDGEHVVDIVSGTTRENIARCRTITWQDGRKE